MSDTDVLIQCPIWNVPCIRERCTGYEVHTKNRFKNLKTDKYVPLDQLSMYSNLSQPEKDVTIEREVTIVRECRKLGKIIEIENLKDHYIPNE
jgi:hypothetical protein